MERRVEGPISCFLSSTNLDLVDFETKSRFLVTGNDETSEQTRRILRLQFENAAKREGSLMKEKLSIIRKYKCIQKALEPLEVRMPEEWRDAVAIKGERLGTRRLNKNYISLIKSITFHRQFLHETLEEEEEKGARRFVYMRKEDVELANKIGRVLFANTISDLLPPAKTLLLSIYEMCDAKIRGTKLTAQEIIFSKRDIIECSKMSEWQVRHYMVDLVNLEYVMFVMGRKGQRFAYRLLNIGRITGEDDFDFIDPNRL
jgi:hypothetical protein